MSPPAVPVPQGFTRRALLAASAAGLALLVAGCTGEPGDPREQVTSEQVDELAAQVAVQQALVAAFTAAGTADPALAAAVTAQAEQVQQQLDRLQAASPGASSSASSSAASSSSAAPAPTGPEARAWLRARVAETADSHAAACLHQSGARAALLGSIAAGLRGQDGTLA